jgi:uncharacterized protein YueI
MPPDPQRNARLQAKIISQFQVNTDFFLLLANTLRVKSWSVQLKEAVKSKCKQTDGCRFVSILNTLYLKFIICSALQCFK